MNSLASFLILWSRTRLITRPPVLNLNMKLKYFDISEFDCSETGENRMDPMFLARLDQLRHLCGFAFVVTSGYRSIKHSVEVGKSSPGVHTQGIAADIAVSDGVQRRMIVELALAMGFGGIGVSNGFVHIDDRGTTPVLWGYDD